MNCQGSTRFTADELETHTATLSKKPNMNPPSKANKGFSLLNTTVAKAMNPLPAAISLVSTPNQLRESDQVAPEREVYQEDK